MLNSRNKPGIVHKLSKAKEMTFLPQNFMVF